MPILLVKNNAGHLRLELPPHFDPQAARILRDAAANFGLLQRSEQLEALRTLDVDSDDECETSGHAAVERMRA